MTQDQNPKVDASAPGCEPIAQPRGEPEMSLIGWVSSSRPKNRNPRES